MDETHIVVLTTVGTKQFANDLALSIVDARLAACVQIQAVQSVYRWREKVCSEPEWLLAIKTTAARYAELEQHIRANHSYETPEIVRMPIAGGSREYLAWIGETVGGGHAMPKMDEI
ncbi:MAG TPA: divalent-cation tolerance protein CutA [Acidobacteriaceae bacterium]|jgi:periplasmic divalent cation tolerance protein